MILNKSDSELLVNFLDKQVDGLLRQYALIEGEKSSDEIFKTLVLVDILKDSLEHTQDICFLENL